MFPDPKPPIGEAPSEAELAAFIRSARAHGLGAVRILKQVRQRFAPRGHTWHRNTIQRVVSRIDEENAVRKWLETEAARAELTQLAAIVAASSQPTSHVQLAGATTRLALLDRLLHASRGIATPAELDTLAREITTMRRRPNQRPKAI